MSHASSVPSRIARLLAIAGALASFALAPPARAQSDTVQVAAGADGTGPPYVILDGRRLFPIRAGFKARTAVDRAEAISARLLRLAHDPRFEPDSMRGVETDISTDIASNDVIVMSVIDDDTIGTGHTRQALGAEQAEAMRAALLQYRKDYGARSVAFGILWSLLATLGLVIALGIIRGLRRRLNAWVGAFAESRREKIRARTLAMLEVEPLVRGLQGVTSFLSVLAVLVSLYVYVGLMLSFFPWTRGFAAQLADLVLAPLRTLAVGVWRQLPGIVFIAVLWLVTYYVIKLVRFIFTEVEHQRVKIEGFYPEWAEPTYRLVRTVIIGFAVVVAYPYIPGSGSDAFKGISIFAGVLFSLGSTSAVGNVVAGIVIIYMRSFRIGDVIQVGENLGVVIETNTFATRLRTPKNVEITIPNAVILASNVVNYSAEAADRGLILHTEVGIGYNAPWRQVHALLLRAAARTDGVLKEPAPFVLQRQLGDFAVKYQLNAYTDQPQRMNLTYAALHKHIQDEFNEFGVEIMTPAYEGDRDEPTFVPKAKWYAPPAKQPGEPGADE